MSDYLGLALIGADSDMIAEFLRRTADVAEEMGCKGVLLLIHDVHDVGLAWDELTREIGYAAPVDDDEPALVDKRWRGRGQA